METYKDKFNNDNRNRSDLRCLNESELRELKETLLSIFFDILKVCDDYNLVCMLGGGSCLGSIRHKGFIPWDDDLDLIMPRTDYEKFKLVFEKEMGDKYYLDAPNYSNNPTNRFPKVMLKGTKFVEVGMPDDERACIKVDIFPIENIPNNFLQRIIKGLRCTILMFIAGHVQSYECYKINKNSGKENMNMRELIGMFFSFRSSERWFNRFDKVVRHDSETNILGIPSGRKHYFGEIFQREVFFPKSEGEFEGQTVFLPHDCHKYLTNLYGDYMIIPPEEKREKHYIERIEF